MLNFKKLNKSNYKIVHYNKKYFSTIGKLFNKIYSLKKPKSFFEYNLSKNPYGTPIKFLMKQNNQIVGSHFIRPLVLKIKNRDFLGGLTYSTMTHPLHQNKGIFTSLASKTHQEAKKRNYNFVLGFASKNSIHGYKNRLGHTELGPINFIRINKTDFGIDKFPKVYDHWFPKNIGRLNDEYKIRTKFPVRIERDNEFIHWRYKKNPTSRYLTCYEPGEYFFIFKKYFDSLHIIDFFGKGNDFNKLLLSTASHLAKKTSCKEVTMWISKKHPLMKLLTKKSMIKLKQQQFLHVTVFNKSLSPTIMNFNNWYYTMGDSDVF